MPRYDFVCDVCGLKMEETVPSDATVDCPLCRLPMRRLPPTGVAGYVH